MPCDTIQLSRVEFLAKSTDVSLLIAALKAQGYDVSSYNTIITFYKDGRNGRYDSSTGELQLPQEWNGSTIKQGYSEQVVTSQAKRQGWQLEWTTNAQGNREAKVQKRG